MKPTVMETEGFADNAGEVLRAYLELMDELFPHLTPAEQIAYQRLFRLSHVRGMPTATCRYTDLASQCGLSLRTLQRALKSLRQKHLVATVWQSHGATTFTVRLLSQFPQRPAFLPRQRRGSIFPSRLSAPSRPPVYDAFSIKDRALFLSCKRGLSPSRLNELTEEAVEWLTDRAEGDPEAFSDEALRDKVDELVMGSVFGPERQQLYRHLFDRLYQREEQP